MFPFAHARWALRWVRQRILAPQSPAAFEFLEIRNYLSVSPNDVFATPQVSIIPDINLSVVRDR